MKIYKKTKHKKNVLQRDGRPLTVMAMIAMAMVLLFACGMGQRGSAPPPELYVDVLLAGTQGGGIHQEPSAEWITSREELDQLFNKLSAAQLPAQDPNKTTQIDFSVSRFILVSMGQKPTAGYSLKLDPESCSITKNSASISLVWSEPDPGMVSAQVITNPFILLRISKGGYDAVKIVDQHGQTWFDLLVVD